MRPLIRSSFLLNASGFVLGFILQLFIARLANSYVTGSSGATGNHEKP